MDIKYKGAEPREVAPAYHPGFDVAPGQIVSVDDALAESLLQQVDLWERVVAPKKKEA